MDFTVNDVEAASVIDYLLEFIKVTVVWKRKLDVHNFSLVLLCTFRWQLLEDMLPEVSFEMVNCVLLISFREVLDGYAELLAARQLALVSIHVNFDEHLWHKNENQKNQHNYCVQINYLEGNLLSRVTAIFAFSMILGSCIFRSLLFRATDILTRAYYHCIGKVSGGNVLLDFGIIIFKYFLAIRFNSVWRSFVNDKIWVWGICATGLVALVPWRLPKIINHIFTWTKPLIRIQILIIHFHITAILTFARLKPLLNCFLKIIVVFFISVNRQGTGAPEVELYFWRIGCLDGTFILGSWLCLIFYTEGSQLLQLSVFGAVDVNCVAIIDILKDAHILALPNIAYAEPTKCLIESQGYLGLIPRREGYQDWYW